MTTTTAEKQTCKHQQLTDPIFTQTGCHHLELTSYVKDKPECRWCGKKVERAEAKKDD